MTNDEYKKYSLENLSKWFSDAISSTEATPEEIFDTLKEVVQEEYSYHLDKLSRASVLSYRFGISGADLIKPKSSKDVLEKTNNDSNDSWTLEEALKESQYYSSIADSSAIDFSKLNEVTFSSCSADDTTPGCVTSWNDFWEEHYYPEEHNTHVTEDGDIYTSKSDKVVKWRLPVEIDGVSGDYYFTLPEDLLEQTGWKENDSLHWIDNNDGSFTLQKVEEPEETKL
jgi:hypothetical protein